MKFCTVIKMYARHFCVLCFVLACVSMWGCSEDRVRWNEGFSGAEIVGFVDDSLVMVGSYQMRTESHEGLFEPYWDVIESGHERLCVYNYRMQEDGPRWCDTLGEYNMTNAFRGQMTDSIIWGGDMPNSIRLWKIGKTQHQIKLKKITEGCVGEFGIASIKQWLDGRFIARGDNSLNAGGNSCQYAILDTIAGTLTFKRLGDDLEWIKECDDVRAWDDDVYCLKRDGLDFLRLLVNYKNMDSIFVNSISFWDSLTISLAPLSFYGNMIYWAYVNSIDSEKWKIKLNPNIRPLSFPSFGEFIDEKKKVISY